MASALEEIMEIEIAKLEAFARLAGSHLRKASISEKSALSRVGIPLPLYQILCDSWLGDYGQIGGLEIYDTESIIETLEERYCDLLHPAGFLAVGKGPNGDILVIRFDKEKTKEVGFIQIASWDVSASPDENAFIVIESDLGEFIDRALVEKDLPADSYEIDEK